MHESNFCIDLTRFCDVMSESPRITMVAALMHQQCLPASSLARLVQMSPQATRFHLRKLEDSSLIRVRVCGRHRYYEIATPEAAELIERIFGILPPPRCTLPVGLSVSAFAEARTCYNHLAGHWATTITDTLIRRGMIAPVDDIFDITLDGYCIFQGMGLVFPNNRKNKLLAKRCIDVTERKDHIGGYLGACLLDWMVRKEWFYHKKSSRVLEITDTGRQGLHRFDEITTAL